MNGWNWFTDLMGYTNNKTNEILDKGAQEANAKLQEGMDQLGSAKELYKEGKDVAGAAANNKAGIAKKQAKAAASMNNVSKTQAALMGAQAANDAATAQYGETANAAANLEASGRNAVMQAKAAQANNINAAEQNKAQAEENRRKNFWDRVGTTASTIASFTK